jgi:hypothetical protein
MERPLTNDEAAARIGIKPSTLKFWRHVGKGPVFCKLGDAKQAGVVYHEADILAWIAQRKFTSTSAHTAAAKRHSPPSDTAV